MCLDAKKIESLSKETKGMKKNQMKILELKKTITEKKNLIGWAKQQNGDESVNLKI